MKISKPQTSLPKQDPAAYVPGTPTLAGPIPGLRALRAVAPPLLLYDCGVWFLPEVRESITRHTAYNKHDTGWAKGAPSEDHTTPPFLTIPYDDFIKIRSDDYLIFI